MEEVLQQKDANIERGQEEKRSSDAQMTDERAAILAEEVLLNRRNMDE